MQYVSLDFEDSKPENIEEAFPKPKSAIDGLLPASYSHDAIDVSLDFEDSKLESNDGAFPKPNSATDDFLPTSYLQDTRILGFERQQVRNY